MRIKEKTLNSYGVSKLLTVCACVYIYHIHKDVCVLLKHGRLRDSAALARFSATTDLTLRTLVERASVT